MDHRCTYGVEGAGPPRAPGRPILWGMLGLLVALLLVLVLSARVLGAPQLKDRPLSAYEQQVVPGLVVYGGYWGWVRVTDAKGPPDDPVCQFEPALPGPVWNWHARRSSIARWLRDYGENRGPKPD